MRTWLAIAACVVAVSSAFALGTIEATVDRDKLTVGDPFTYTVNMLLPAGAQAELPGDKAKFKGLEIRNYQPQEVPQQDGSRQIVLRYTLVCFEVGIAGIKDFRIPVRMPKGEPEKWLAPPVEVKIESVLPQQGQVQPKGFAGPIMLASSWTQWLWAGLIALLVIAAIVVGIVLWRRRRQARPAVAAERILEPDAAALHALGRLQQEELIQTEQFLPFYQRLDEILRAWLQARFDIPALERTTMGTMYFLRVRREADEWRGDYLELLKAADRVKYANLPPTNLEARAHVEQAERVIAAAHPEPEPAPPAEPGGGRS
jgi:hypothetical protein